MMSSLLIHRSKRKEPLSKKNNKKGQHESAGLFLSIYINLQDKSSR